MTFANFLDDSQTYLGAILGVSVEPPSKDKAL